MNSLIQRTRETDIAVLQEELNGLKLNPKTIKEIKKRLNEYLGDRDDFYAVLPKGIYHSPTNDDIIRIRYYICLSESLI